MGKKKEIILDEGEVEKLLKGSLHWNDIATRIDGRQRRSGIRRLQDPLPPRDYPPPLQWKNLNAQELTYRGTNWQPERQQSEGGQKAPAAEQTVSAQPGEKQTKSKAELLEQMFSAATAEEEEYAEAGVSETPQVWEGKGVVVFVSSVGLLTLFLWCYYLFV